MLKNITLQQALLLRENPKVKIFCSQKDYRKVIVGQNQGYIKESKVDFFNFKNVFKIKHLRGIFLLEE